MNDKEQIEEIVKKVLKERTDIIYIPDFADPISEALSNAGYKKVSEEDIIITEDENLKNLNHTATCVRNLKTKIRKETAKEIYAFLINHCDLHYIDIHNLITFIKEEYEVEIKE